MSSVCDQVLLLHWCFCANVFLAAYGLTGEGFYSKTWRHVLHPAQWTHCVRPHDGAFGAEPFGWSVAPGKNELDLRG